MSHRNYPSAPVSEVIFGVTFNSAVLAKNNYYIKLLARLSDRYERVDIMPPLPNEELKGFQRNLFTNSLITGPALHRLRTRDNSWLIQIQWNKIYVNWLRDDTKNVGSYPGYNSISRVFLELLADVSSELGLTEADHSYYDLTYHDRIRWEEYIKKLNDVDQIINIKTPFANGGFDAVNYTMGGCSQLDKIDSFLFYEYASATEFTGKQILQLQFSIKSHAARRPQVMVDWFDKAHKIHLDLFESVVNDKYLTLWT